jgi:hypothetical protein
VGQLSNSHGFLSSRLSAGKRERDSDRDNMYLAFLILSSQFATPQSMAVDQEQGRAVRLGEPSARQRS